LCDCIGKKDHSNIIGAMPRNSEIKLRFPDELRYRTVEAAAKKLNAHHVLIQQDTYYPTKEPGVHRVKLRNNVPQGVGEQMVVSELIAYKRGNTEDSRLSSYVKTPVTNLSETLAQLEKAYGKPEVTVCKVRTIVIYQERTRIHLDVVQGLTPAFFLELEVMLGTYQSHEVEGQHAIQSVLDLLGITQEERTTLVERGSYRELLLSVQ
jgi:adenylate cyclase class IV